jgi:hypothetical protein
MSMPKTKEKTATVKSAVKAKAKAKPAPKAAPVKITGKHVSVGVASLSEKARSKLFDELLDNYCLICGGTLKKGECPKGCETGDEPGDGDEEE